MSRAGVPVEIGTRVLYRGELAEIIELAVTRSSPAVIVRVGAEGRMIRIALREFLDPQSNIRIVPQAEGPSATDPGDVAAVTLSTLSSTQLQDLQERVAHVREVTTGYRSGSAELAQEHEPRPEYDPSLPLSTRYLTKANELGVSKRTVQEWVALYRGSGEAGLVRRGVTGSNKHFGRVDLRWVETALEVMTEHINSSRPSQLVVMDRTNARVRVRFGEGSVPLPSQATAYRVLNELERRHPLFRLSTKRNRDIATRPSGEYGKLRPTRPGEYVLLDTTRLDVFGFDPVTLHWVQAELTVAMDWYWRGVVGVWVTPVSTKAIDAAATLYQVFRPPPAGKDWPAHAFWASSGVPRTVMVDPEAVEGPLQGLAHPPLVPETVVVDHGKIYLSEHLLSVCRRMGISVQPARLRTGRDKGPIERFFRTLREDLLQVLPGYKGPDIHSRGLDPESDAYFYLDELQTIIREWVAVAYHHRPHDSLSDPFLPSLKLSPAKMFEHGLARAGYVEVPRDPNLALEFLKVEWRTVQHYGIEWARRRYRGNLSGCTERTVWLNEKQRRAIPVHVCPDDITRIYVRADDGEWRTLTWEHAASLEMPLSEDALRFARRLAAAKYTYSDDKLAIKCLLERWNLGLGTSLPERRMALRLAREQSLPPDEFPTPENPDSITQLPSVRKALEALPEEQEGDDDSDEELDPYDATTPDDHDDFYADALEDI